MTYHLRLLCTAALIALPVAANAQDAPRVGITDDMASVTVDTPDGPVEIARDQTEGAKLEGDWAIVNRDCPPFCIQPHQAADGTHTIGELELLEMLKAGDTILVDSRTPDWFTTGTIPSAINIPYTQAVERLAELNCEPDFDGKFACDDASKVILFCNGLWCGQSPTAMRAMIEAGYPADRIYWYRGGMQSWRLLGFTVAGGANPAPMDAIAAQDASPAEAAEPGAAPEATTDPAAQPGADAEQAEENPVTDGTTEEAAEGTEAPAEAETEAGAGTDTEAGTETEAEAEAEAEAEPEAEATDPVTDAINDAEAAIDEATKAAEEAIDQVMSPPAAEAEAGTDAEAETPPSN